MCMVAEQTFENSPRSVAAARQTATEALHTWGVRDDDPLVGATALVTSELMTNAVRVSLTAVQIRLTSHRDSVEVAVSDDYPVAPVPGRLTTSDISGRGLAIVAAVANEWGYNVVAGRSKTVWCRLAVPKGSAFDLGCPN